ncbi:MAG: hypothetical protein ACJ8AD_19720, partial [Gemmatimonadaceae bacterium]
VGDVGAMRLEQDWVSPVYGTRSLAPCIRVSSLGAGRREIITLLVPESADGSAAVRELPASGGRAVTIDRPEVESSDLLLVRTSGVARVGGIEMDADLALIRRDASAGDVRWAALFGDQARLSVDGVSLEASGAAEFVRHGAGWAVEGAGRVVVR